MKPALERVKYVRFDTSGAVQLLKDAINEKFGTAAKFCRCTGEDLTKLHENFRAPDTLRRNQELSRIRVLVDITDPVDLTGVELSLAQREVLRKAIICEFKSVRSFCADRPWFKEAWVSHVLSGRLKRRTNKVKQLAQTLFIDLDEIIRSEGKLLQEKSR